MIREYHTNFNSAVEGAYRILLQRDSNAKVNKAKKNKAFNYEILSNSNNGDKVFLFGNDNSTSLTFYPAEEFGGYTYQFRRVLNLQACYLIGMGETIVRPLQEISPEEAITYRGAKKINSFFGEDRDLREPIDEDYISVISNEFLSLPYLRELIGRDIKISSQKEYLQVVKEIIKKFYKVEVNLEELEEEKKEYLYSLYQFAQGDLFLKYSLYEFLRTEEYFHLTQTLKKYKVFDLPIDWSKHLYYMGRKSPEYWILTKYSSNKLKKSHCIGVRDIRALATYIDAPYRLVLEAIREDIWDSMVY